VRLDEENRQLEKLHDRVSQVHSANTTVKFRLPLINPVFAQLETVLLCCFLAVKDRTLDAFDFYNRAEATNTKSLWKFLTATT
jgi:hypothetical protein